MTVAIILHTETESVSQMFTC